jgi:hypothetical protein
MYGEDVIQDVAEMHIMCCPFAMSGSDDPRPWCELKINPCNKYYEYKTCPIYYGHIGRKKKNDLREFEK